MRKIHQDVDGSVDAADSYKAEIRILDTVSVTEAPSSLGPRESQLHT